MKKIISLLVFIFCSTPFLQAHTYVIKRTRLANDGSNLYADVTRTTSSRAINPDDIEYRIDINCSGSANQVCPLMRPINSGEI